MQLEPRATIFVWRALGCPQPLETSGEPIIPRGAPGRCAHCGTDGARFALEQAISDRFTTVRNASILWPHGGERLCAGCTWAFKALLVRCGLCFARVADAHGPGGVWPVPIRPQPRPAGWPATRPWPFGRPDPLATLLAPPPAPFVAWLPLYGVDHGGEAHIHRTFCADGRGGVFRPADPLWKLQAKHALPFAKVSPDARRYDLAIDDTNIAVDVGLWSAVRAVAAPLLADLRSGGVGAEDAKAALRTLTLPRGAPLPLVPSWRARVEPLRPHAGARWFELFVDLLPMPPLVKRDRTLAAGRAPAMET